MQRLPIKESILYRLSMRKQCTIIRLGRWCRVSKCPFEIYDASTASYGKKVSSTYQRYACGTFLPNSLYLHRLFQKAYGKVCFKCCRVCRNAGDTAHLLRCIIKSVHPCTLLMANFGFAEISLLFKPVASVPMFKRQCRLNLQVLLLAKRCCRKSSTYQNAQGRAWFPAIAIFWLCQNSRSKIDKEVNF